LFLGVNIKFAFYLNLIMGLRIPKRGRSVLVEKWVISMLIFSDNFDAVAYLDPNSQTMQKTYRGRPLITKNCSKSMLKF